MSSNTSLPQPARLRPAALRPAAPRPLTICRVQSRICIGGPAQHTLILSSRLTSGYRTILIGGGLDHEEHDLAGEARACGVETLVIPSMRRRPGPLADLCALIALWRLFRRERPAIVHTHTAKAGALGRLAARLAGVPVVVHTFHGHVFEGYFPRWVTRLIILAEQVLARLSDAVIVLSTVQYHDIVRRFRVAPAGKVHIIPLGLDLEAFAAASAASAAWERGALRRELGCARDALLVGIVGRLAPVKNHELFLEAAARLCELLPGRDLQFVVVGDGARRAAVEALARRLGLAARVRFLGWRRDLAPVMADLDLLVSTSRSEGTPAAIIEAMAAGVPIVATAVGGVEDIMGGYRAARVVATFDPVEVAAAMASLLREPAARVSHGVERFGARRLVSDMEALYARLLAARGIEPPSKVAKAADAEDVHRAAA